MNQLRIAFLLTALTACASQVPATSYIKRDAIQTNDLQPTSQLTASLLDKKMILIGENHGTNEAPEMAFKIIKALGNEKLIVGLEFPTDIQSPINKFLKSGKESILRETYFFQNAEYHSGRGSKAMIQLLKNLRTLPNVEVFCFDVTKEYKGKDRDSQMAKNIVGKTHGDPRTFIALTGNIHSRLVPGTPWNPNHVTMGAEILRLSNGEFNLLNSTNILLRNSGGSAWQCVSDNKGPINCGLNNFGPSLSPYATEVPFDFYYLKEPQIKDGHFNTFFIRKVSASEPF